MIERPVRILALLVVAAVVLLGSLSPILAVTPYFWEVRSWDEFRKGKLDGLSLTRDGELILAPRFQAVFQTEQPFVWSMASDDRGNVYLGTGHDGKVYRVDPLGAGAMIADLPELDVLALAVDPAGAVYAGTAPDGKIYKIEPGRDPKVFFDPHAKYIWSLAFDKEGRLFAGTGDKGVIYRVTPDGRGESFYDTDEANIVSLAIDNDANVIAGGDPKGYVYRISPAGKAFVLYDSGMREAHALALGPNGTIYAAFVNPKKSPRPGSASVGGDSSVTAGDSELVVSVGAGRVSQSDLVIEVVAESSGSGGGDSSSTSSSSTETETGASGMIVEIRPDGVVNTLWKGDEMVYGLLPHAGRILFSTGTKGRVYSLGGVRDVTLVVESTEEQTTRLIAAGGRIYASSANAGKLFSLTDELRTSGTYESTVRDAESVASWGKVSSRSRQSELIQILTRTGNTASPDKTWSDWTPVDNAGSVLSPRARFIQWKAAVKAAASAVPGAVQAALQSVTVAYLQPNLQPAVVWTDVLSPGVALAKPATQNGTAPVNELGAARASIRAGSSVQRPQPRRVNQKGAQAFQWAASDRNQDLLRYDLYYREISEREWRLLKGEIDDSFYTIESDALPDGTYLLRVVASDVLSNPPGTALTGEEVSRPFIIDNTPPGVTMKEAGGQVLIEAADGTSTLLDAQVSVDGGEWRPIFPSDGILDSKSESFVFVLDRLGSGTHVVAFRVYDQAENIGSGKLPVRIP